MLDNNKTTLLKFQTGVSDTFDNETVLSSIKLTCKKLFPQVTRVTTGKIISTEGVRGPWNGK